MRITFLTIASFVLLAIAYSFSAGAGTIADVDGDNVPDVFDNCSTRVNGQTTGGLNKMQIDTDSDGFGDACDCDFTQDGFVLGGDISNLFGFFNGTDQLHDLTGDGFVLGGDVSFCFGQFNSTPGPGATAQ